MLRPSVSWLLLALCPLSGCALFELAAIRSSFPPLEGELDAPGLDDEVVILRDDVGVAHVRARTEHDAWFAQGFVHGQERYWQADLNRRLVWGRVSEWLGDGAADLDAFLRTMKLRDRAEALLAAQDREAQAMFEAYADGMNAGLASLPNRAIEYRLLGVDPEAWDPVDSYGILFLMAWNLTENPEHETAAWLLRDRLDAATLSDLYAFHPDVPDVDPWWDELRRVESGPFTAGFEAFTGALGGRPEAPEASNNWVVGPSLSTSGAPLLANDPHLGQRVPSLWHASTVEAPGLRAGGVTLPGLPGYPIGHTGQAAWGLTNVMADVVDFAVLERVGETGYLLDGEPRTFGWVRTRLEEGLDAPVERTNLTTELGPVVTGAGGTHVLAMRWHALTVDDRLPEVLHGLAHATSADDVLAALDRPAILAQNVAFADAAGAYGYQSSGTVPKRFGTTGRTPYPGSRGEAGWDGWLAGLPGERDPERGYAVTANTRPTSTQSADGTLTAIDIDAITTSWVAPHRDARLHELLGEGGSFSAADLRRQQLDVLDVTARRVVPWLLEGVTAPAGAEPCLDRLRRWDFRWTADSAGAAVWSRVHPRLTEHLVGRWLDAEQTALFLASVGTGRGVIDARLTELVQDREAAARAALSGACEDLRASLGEDPERWTWGDLHPLELKHAIADGQDILGYWHMPPVPFGGSGSTVAAASYAFAPDERGLTPVTGMASVRFVVDMAAPEDATVTYPGGQVGHPAHPDYATHYDAFVAGEALPLRWSEVDVDGFTVHELRLIPLRLDP